MYCFGMTVGETDGVVKEKKQHVREEIRFVEDLVKLSLELMEDGKKHHGRWRTRRDGGTRLRADGSKAVVVVPIFQME